MTDVQENKAGVLGVTELTQVDLSSDTMDYLARMVKDRWNTAVMWRNTVMCGDRTLGRVLKDCYNQKFGILSGEDRDLVKELQIRKETYINISALKTSTVVAWLRDIVLNANELPFVVNATPIPELSPRARMEVLQRVKRKLFMEQFSGDLVELVKQLKFMQLQEENKYAKEAAENMQRLIKDQCVEGSFDTTLLSFLNDFVMYPYAVMHGPVPIRKIVMEWSGKTLVKRERVVMSFVPVSTWDFLWTPDSPDPHKGMGVFIRETMTVAQLKQCMSNKYYLQDNVRKVVEKGMQGTLPRNWASGYDEKFAIKQWQDTDVVDIIKHYGKVSGRELSKYGILGVDMDTYYDTCIDVAGGLTIRAYISPMNNLGIRPVSTASFETVSGSIAGEALCQKVRNVELMYQDNLRYLMVNAAYAAGPIAEVDYQRIAPYMDSGDVGKLVPLTAYPVDPDSTQRGVPAFRFQQVPTNMNAYVACADYFMALADKVSNIPAALHAEPVGTGANRTFRGISMLQGNAMKPLQSAVSNMDKTVFKNVGTALYTYNMIFSKDDSVKGDAKVDASGASGLLQKEIDRQNALDILQLVGQVPAEVIPPTATQWAVRTALETMGVPMQMLDNETQNGLNSSPQAGIPPQAGDTMQSVPQEPVAEQGIPQAVPQAVQ